MNKIMVYLVIVSLCVAFVNTKTGAKKDKVLKFYQEKVSFYLFNFFIKKVAAVSFYVTISYLKRGQ